MKKDNNYFTKLIYNKYSWNYLYDDFKEKKIIQTDNYSKIYINKFLKDIKNKNTNKKVLNLGSGREAINFYKLGFEVYHIGQNAKITSKINKINKKRISSRCIDFMSEKKFKDNYFDIIFLAGIIQHFSKPDQFLEKIIKKLKIGGFCYMGFYRSGEFKYFIVDTIRYLIEDFNNENHIKNFRNINSILHTFGEFKHYQNARLLDDFFISYKYCFDPKKILGEIKKNGCKIYKYNGDYKTYNHNNFKYFSQKGDRVIFKKNFDMDTKISEFKNVNQLTDIHYNKQIQNNITIIKKLKRLLKKKKNTHYLPLICTSLYQFTRPWEQKSNFIFKKMLTYKNRHYALNKYLSNLLKILK